MLGLNNTLTATTVLEMNRKAVNDVHLRMLKSGSYTIGAEDAALLLPIAQQCPNIGGTAVYRARNLYGLYMPRFVFTDDASCSEGRSQEESENGTVHNQEKSVTITPNPVTDGKALVSLSNSKDAIARLSLMGSMGSKITDFTVSEQGISSQEIQIPKLPTGVYYLQVITTQGGIYVEPIVIR